jgi:hypothetical protein
MARLTTEQKAANHAAAIARESRTPCGTVTKGQRVEIRKGHSVFNGNGFDTTYTYFEGVVTNIGPKCIYVRIDGDRTTTPVTGSNVTKFL